MKFRVTFKDPDTLGDAIREAVTAEVAVLPEMDDEERDVVTEIRIAKVTGKVHKWFPYGEYVTIECDTDTGTAVVVPNA